MRTTQKKKSIYWSFGIIGISLAVYVFFLISNSDTQKFEVQNQVEETKQEEVISTTTLSTAKKQNVAQATSSLDKVLSPKATLTISNESFEFSLLEEMTVYDAMNLLKKENKITFEGKNYPALGFFVTKINSLEAGDGKNLMYDINGVEASVGISAYEIKEGDIIEWKLK